MPQKTIFIRDGDLDKWNAIERKSEFIHNALNYDVAHTHPKDAYSGIPIKAPIRLSEPPDDWEGPIPKKGKK